MSFKTKLIVKELEESKVYLHFKTRGTLLRWIKDEYQCNDYRAGQVIDALGLFEKDKPLEEGYYQKLKENRLSIKDLFSIVAEIYPELTSYETLNNRVKTNFVSHKDAELRRIVDAVLAIRSEEVFKIKNLLVCG